MQRNLNYKNRYGEWALISGAAQGIGAAFCDRLASMDMSLIMLDINAPNLEGTAADLRQKHPNVAIKTRVVDLSDANAVNKVLDQLEHIDIGLLVANAGLGAVGRWLDIPLETKINQIAVNCTSPLILTHRLTPAMANRRRGGIIIMASGSADLGSSFIATYAATKAFDRVLAEGLWAELSPYGIDVTAVMPGAVNTPGFRDTVPSGKQPTKLMQPVDPYVVVDAALQGLGSTINIRPGGSHGLSSLLMKLMLTILPRKRLLQLGNKAVIAMYDR